MPTGSHHGLPAGGVFCLKTADGGRGRLPKAEVVLCVFDPDFFTCYSWLNLGIKSFKE